MSVDAWIVLVVVIGTMAVLATERCSTVVGLGGAVLLLLVTGAIDDATALSGLASPATATIALLYVVAGGVAATGALSWLVDRILFGRTGSIARLTSAMAAMSAFVPNTPLVALAAPRAVRWSRASGRSASGLLMPLSFAGILGGVVTVLGTSTNLVVSDLLENTHGDALGVFEITRVGAPVALVGIVTMSLTLRWLLPDRIAAGESMRATARTYQLQMLVDPAGPLVGATVDAAGLRALDGLYLAAVERDDRIVTVRPETRLDAGDRLYFVGDVTRVVDVQEVAGLVSAEQPHMLLTEGPGVRLYEAVVSGQSALAGRTLKQAGFRVRYGAAVLAVHRADGDLRGKLGSIPLAVGDVLLVLASPDFAHRWREHHDFSLVASVDEPPPPRRARAGIAVAAFATMIVLAASGTTSLLVAAALAAAVMVAGRVLSLHEGRRAIDVGVVLTIALSISLGAAVERSGLAGELSAVLVDVADPFGEVGLLFTLIVATQLLTEVLSNSGAAALMVPVALGAAAGVGGDPREFAIGVLVGASCSFLTPVGYQTNLMVFGLGGYRFTDFTRVGLPLTVTSALTATAALVLS